jgi:hypothetical protein
MKKLLFTLLTVTALPSFAYFNYSNFQQFDNQVSFGLNTIQGNLSTSDAAGNSNSYGVTGFNLEVEKLFDIGLWLDVNMGNIQVYTQTNNEASPLGAYPFIASLNAKLGYNIPFTQFFSLTPYALLGKNANVTLFTGTGVLGGTGKNVTQDYFYTIGFGARAEFPINKYIDIFLDQSIVYNDDQTKLIADNGLMITASNFQTVSTAGVKVNLAQNLQLAGNIFYNTYTGYDSNTLALMNAPGGQDGLPTTAFGAQASVGFTFK